MLINSKNIFYRVNKPNFNKNDPTLIFVHGNSSSSSSFEKQINSPELLDFNLIALDLPGHGNSEHYPSAQSDQSIYTIAFYSSIIHQLIKELDLHNIYLIGHSLGGHITLDLAKSMNIMGLINIQNTPINEVSELGVALNQDPKFHVIYADEVSDENIAVLAQSFFNCGDTPHWFQDNFKSTDPKCRTNLAMSITPELDLKEIDFIKNSRFKYTLFIGTNDEITSIEYLKQCPIAENIKFIKNTSHYPHFEDAETFNKLLKEQILAI